MGRPPDALTRSVAERSLMGSTTFNLLGYDSPDPASSVGGNMPDDCVGTQAC